MRTLISMLVFLFAATPAMAATDPGVPETDTLSLLVAGVVVALALMGSRKGKKK